MDKSRHALLDQRVCPGLDGREWSERVEGAVNDEKRRSGSVRSSESKGCECWIRGAREGEMRGEEPLEEEGLRETVCAARVRNCAEGQR